MAMLIDALKLTLPLAAFNGGVLIKPDLKTVVDQKFLPVGVPEKVIEAIDSHGSMFGSTRTSNGSCATPMRLTSRASSGP